MSHNRKYTPVRFSHLTSDAGVGAIVRDANDMLMAVADIRYWTDRNNTCTAEPLGSVTRIINALDIGKQLRIPPDGKELDNGILQGHYLPAVLFPRYAICKKCGLLHNNPWKEIKSHLYEQVKCNNKKCNGVLEQVTWCAVSIQGYLDDVPWHYICHLGSNQPCRADFEDSYLRLINDRNGKKIIECMRCKSKHQLIGKKIGVINRQQPWLFGKPEPIEEQDVEIMEINNPGVYFPERANALVIPPESRRDKGSVVDRLYRNSLLVRKLESIQAPLLKKGKIKKLATEFRCTPEDIHDALQQIRNGYPDEEIISSGDMLEDEYKEFKTPLEDMREDEDFVTEHKTALWQELKPSLSNELLSINQFIDTLIVARRLREIQIFKGFRRQDPDPDKSALVPPDIVGSSDWLPAVELFGEGVFFTLDEGLLTEWEKIEGVKARADEVAKRYESSGIKLYDEPTVTPRFILLHTLSHLLIREFEATCGYPAASMKERIYCSAARKMAGILIFIAVPDIAGSLGGIIESAEPKKFLNLLDGVFKHACWCSLDPVCSEHEGQGPGWLNRAACHACTLIPETGCAYNNIFLDRIFIKGNPAQGIPNLLEYIGEQINGKKDL